MAEHWYLVGWRSEIMHVKRSVNYKAKVDVIRLARVAIL